MRLIRGFLARLSGKLFIEVLPVALASVTGTLIVNHYSARLVSPVVVQPPPPPAGADALFQALRDEHQLVVDYLKRDAAAAASKAGKVEIAPPAAEPPRDRPRSRVASVERTHKAAAAAGAKAPPEIPPPPVLAAVAYEDLAPPPPEPRTNGMLDMVSASVEAVVHLPERALAFRFLSDERPSPPALIPPARADGP